MRSTALITGITGQDGSYLARLLLDKGYVVHGLIRPVSTDNTQRLSDILSDITLHHGDLTDSSAITQLIAKIKPDEIYHLAAQSHVRVSFDLPHYTAQVVALGTLNLLEAIRIIDLEKRVRFYQASTSELFGRSSQALQNEDTLMQPCSPYACAKLYAYWMVRNYREGYGMFACNGILFNHESPLRGDQFVTRKITKHVARISAGYNDVLGLGNLDASRDWGHAEDFVKGMWVMLQHDKPEDFVLATGQATTVRSFVEKAFKEVGIDIKWQGDSLSEQGIDSKTGKTLISISKEHFRPIEVHNLIGDASKAKKILKWRPEKSLEDLIQEMVQYDVSLVSNDRKGGAA